MRNVFLTGMLAMGIAVCGCSSNEATPVKVDPSAKIEPQSGTVKGKELNSGGVRNLPGPGKK